MKLRWVIAVAAVMSAACANKTNPCDRKSLCPNDPPLSDAQRQECNNGVNQWKNEACYSEVLALMGCFADNAVCGSDGKIDRKASGARSQNNCAAQLSSETTCCQKNPTAPSCPRL